MLEIVVWIALLALLFFGDLAALAYCHKLFGLKPIPVWRSTLAVGAVAALTIGLVFLCWFVVRVMDLAPMTIVGGFVAALAVLTFATLWIVLRLSLGDTLRAFLLVAWATGTVLIAEVVLMFPFQRFYSIPMNSMAPTLVGRHFVGACPHCGEVAIVPYEVGRSGEVRAVGEQGICTQCLKIGEATDVDERKGWSDRILASYLASPKRWDLVVFRFPQDRRQVYVKRLVGLPGETVEIRDGSIWINGREETPPPELRDLRWEIQLPEFSTAPGPEYACDSPYELGPDDFFVLGDFSTRSYDSRFWGPVSRADILGAVTLIYFPPQRWRVFPRHGE
jgi:signal peptidase I